MLESIIQIIVVVGLSVFLRAFGKDEFGNSNASDKKLLNQCSFQAFSEEATEEVGINLNLCSLEGNVILNVSQRTSAGGNSPSIKIHRYYWINPFGRIQIAKAPDLSSTNCPINSTSCLVSEVTFQCKDNQDGNGVCFNDQQITADSYGMLGNWTPKIVYPPVSSNGNVKRSTAAITMYGRPCYYCSDNLNLSTVIGFYCDERITGKGKPIIKKQPTKHNPEVLLQWNTSAACYEFIENEKCTFPDFVETFCNENAFGCNSSQDHKNHQYSFPSSKNSSISFAVSSSITYTFGFCARDVECNTRDDKNVMICKKEGQDFKPLGYYNDNVEFIARPTGFVIRIKEQSGDSVKAVISFECSQSTNGSSLMSVLEEDNLPILLIIRHSCFCPNMSELCQDPSSTDSSSTEPSSPDPPDSSCLAIAMIGVLSVVCVIVALLNYVKHKSRTRTRVSAVLAMSLGKGGDGQPETPHHDQIKATEEPPPNNGGDRDSDGNDNDSPRHQMSEGEPLVNDNRKSPPTTYYSCRNTMFYSLTEANNEAHNDEAHNVDWKSQDSLLKRITGYARGCNKNKITDNY